MNLLKNKRLFLELLVFFFIFSSPLFAQKSVQLNSRLEKLGENSYKGIVNIHIKEGLHLYAPGEKTGIPVNVKFVKNSSIEFSDLSYSTPIKKKLSSSNNELLLYEKDMMFSFKVKLKEKIDKFSIIFSWQSCNDTQCFMPESKKITFLIKDAVLSKDKNIKKIYNTEKAGSSASKILIKKEGKFQNWYEKYGILYVILMAFIFGIISSLTPCVYPMIPVTISFFGSKEESSKLRRFIMAFIMAIGIGISFATLGGIFTWLGRDLGSIFASSWAAIIISIVLIIFAMASFEHFEIRMPAFLMKRVEGPNENKGYIGAFIMGLTLGLIAAPCVGPIAGSLLIFAATLHNVLLGFILLFVYGFGIGILFMVVALGASFLPRAGMWMVNLKKGFGVVILLTTIYILQFSIPTWALLIYSAIIFIFSAIALDILVKYDDYSSFSAVMSKTISISFFITGVILLYSGLSYFIPQRGIINGNCKKIELNGKLNWIRDHDEAIKLGIKENKPVFMDFYADWCIPCKKITKMLHEPDVEKALSRFVVAKLDCTKPGFSAAKIKMNKYKAPYIPFMIFYDSKGNFLEEKTFKGKVCKKKFLERLKTIK